MPRGLASGLARKRRLAVAVLAAYLVWGGVHRWLVQRFDVNPWKLGGMAMYATAAPKITIGFYREVDGRLEPLRITSRAEDQPLFLRYFEHRRHAGLLLRPDALARRIFAERSEVDTLAIVVTRLELDAETATIVASRRGYRYQRDS